jgi:Mce-associated membrane protein
MLLAGLLCLLVLLLLQERSRHGRDHDRDAALAAARQEATNLVNINYATAQRDLQRIVAGATGALRRNFLAERDRFGVLARDKSVTTGTVLTSGLVSLDRTAGVARVAIAADATISDNLHRQPPPTHYRIVLTLRHIGDRWLASDAAFVGAPQ